MSRILDHLGNPIEHHSPGPTVNKVRAIRARFDSEFASDENRRHFALANASSVDAMANASVRRSLRMKSRYEYHNNSYFMGIVNTIANYVIGTGPRLQMLTPNKKLNARVEELWYYWQKEIGLAATLKTSRMARVYNGENFLLQRTNPDLVSPVKLDVFEAECDHVTSPTFGLGRMDDQTYDGIILDRWGKPSKYQILRNHPGANMPFMLNATDYDTWDAKYVLHDFKRIRPGQKRGIPEAIPALPLFAQLRRYTLAVVGAAETAADYAAVMQTNAPANSEEESTVAAFSTFELKARMGVTLPEGYQLSQIKAEQPVTTYDQFVWSLLREICRCLDLPVCFAGMDAEKTNMSSAYVITQPFAKAVEVDRAGYEDLLDKLFDAFLTEAIRVAQVEDDSLLPRRLPQRFVHQWGWDEINTHADPDKVASAKAQRLASGTTTRTFEYSKQGLDVEEMDAAAARENGVTVEEYRALLRQKTFGVPAQQGTEKSAAKEPEEEPVEQE